MYLWITIFIAVITALFGYKKGLYVMFATFFNLMFAVFIAVLSTPKLLSLSGGYEDSGYYGAAGIVLLGILVFGLLQTFAWFWFLQDRDAYFPRFLDKIGAFVLGLLTGYVACSVLFLAFCVMPWSLENAEHPLCSRRHLQTLAVPGVVKVCDFLGWYSLHCFEGNSEKAVTQLLALAQPDTEEQEESAPADRGPSQTPPPADEPTTPAERVNEMLQ